MQQPLVPAPPFSLPGDPAIDAVVTTVMASLFVAAVAYALWTSWRSGSAIVLLMLVGGGCMMVMEPLVDTTAGVWFASSSRMFLHGYGRSIPVWVCLTYFVYFGVGSAILWQWMQRGITVRQLWLVYCGEVIADTVLESIVLRTGIYTYYGQQPLLLGPFPLWWAAVNALVSLAAALAVLGYARIARGWQLVGIVPLMLCASAAANAAAGWPAWFVINSNLGPMATQAGGLASIAIAFMGVAVAAGLVGTRNAARARPAKWGV